MTSDDASWIAGGGGQLSTRGSHQRSGANSGCTPSEVRCRGRDPAIYAPETPTRIEESGSMRIGHVAFLVRDLDAMVAFYVDVVGLQVTEIGRGGGRASAPSIAFLSWDPATLHHQLAFVETHRDLPPRSVGHVAFEVDGLGDLRPIWERVRTDGRAGGLYPADQPVTAFMGDQWSIRFSDPETNGVEIYAPTPWDTVAAARPYSRTPGVVFDEFDLDLENDALIAWGREHLAALEIEHWPRGERAWPANVERRSTSSP